MNCKPGDLAVIVRSMCGNEGLLVNVLCPAPNVPFGSLYEACGRTWLRTADTSQVWIVRAIGATPLNVKAKAPAMERPVYDGDLRPIRDSDGTDEMLRIAGLPKRDEVKA